PPHPLQCSQSDCNPCKAVGTWQGASEVVEEGKRRDVGQPPSGAAPISPRSRSVPAAGPSAAAVSSHKPCRSLLRILRGGGCLGILWRQQVCERRGVHDGQRNR